MCYFKHLNPGSLWGVTIHSHRLVLNTCLGCFKSLFALWWSWVSSPGWSQSHSTLLLPSKESLPLSPTGWTGLPSSLCYCQALPLSSLSSTYSSLSLRFHLSPVTSLWLFLRCCLVKLSLIKSTGTAGNRQP